MKYSQKRYCSTFFRRYLFIFGVVISLFSLNKVVAQTNSDCMLCHIDEHRKSSHRPGLYVYVNGKEFNSSIHAKKQCISCHKDANVKFPHKRTLSRVKCFLCHEKDFKEAGKNNFHFEVQEANKTTKNKCIICHGKHGINSPSKEAIKIGKKCTTCHLHKNYPIILKESVHKKLSCTHCHSSIDKNFRAHIADSKEYKVASCKSCHIDIAKKHEASVKEGGFPIDCWDCHGTHRIQSRRFHANYPQSDSLAREYGKDLMISGKERFKVPEENKIKGSCISCHKDAKPQFTGFSSVKVKYEKSKYTQFFSLYKFLIAFLLFTILGFGFYMLRTRLRTKNNGVDTKNLKQRLIKRFSKIQVISHILLITSILLLTLSGMLLRVYNMSWSETTLDIIAILHKFGILLLFVLVIYHLFSLWKQKRTQKMSLREFIFRADSLMFNKQDIINIALTVIWKLGKGEKPQYVKWTFLDKFVYLFALFGLVIIGFSGFALWTPELFKGLLSCETLNFFQLLHSNASLVLFVCILIIYFFNTHIHPDSSLKNTVILTGYNVEEGNDESDELVNSTTEEPLKLTVKKARLIGIAFDTLIILTTIILIYHLLF